MGQRSVNFFVKYSEMWLDIDVLVMPPTL